jgi:hypothetical protein
LVSIVSYRTFCRWRNEPVHIKRRPFVRKPGRPRILKFPSGESKCRERLGELLKHYFREAA